MNVLCNKRRRQFTAYLDNELPEADKNQIEKHLETCAACRQELRQLKKSAEMLSAALAEPAAIDFDQAWQAIEGHIQSRPSLWQRLRTYLSRPRIWVPAGAVGVVTAGLLIVAFCWPVFHSPPLARVSRVASVSSKTGNVMVLQSENTQEPIIWIMESTPKEKRS